MKVISEWTTQDRRDWETGPWDQEPDKVQFVDEETGFDALAVRNYHGAWCGYVGVPEGHSWYRRAYPNVPVKVHGDLTFAGFCDSIEDPSQGICHVPREGSTAKPWWLGFDCHHYMDQAPGLDALNRAMAAQHPKYAATLERLNLIGGSYKTLDYVRAEIASLAKQAAETKED